MPTLQQIYTSQFDNMHVLWFVTSGTAVALDGYPDASDRVLAYLGSAEIMAQGDKNAQALEYWQKALDLLPDDHLHSSRSRRSMKN